MGNVVAEKFWIFSYKVLHTGGWVMSNSSALGFSFILWISVLILFSESMSWTVNYCMLFGCLAYRNMSLFHNCFPPWATFTFASNSSDMPSQVFFSNSSFSSSNSKFFLSSHSVDLGRPYGTFPFLPFFFLSFFWFGFFVMISIGIWLFTKDPRQEYMAEWLKHLTHK